MTNMTEINKDHRLALDRIADLEAENKELRISKERCRTLLELSGEGLIIHDQEVLIDANSALPRMFGYPREELIGANVIGLLAVGDSQEVIRRNIAANTTEPYEITARRRDETDFPAELRMKNIVLGDQLLTGIAIRDITERKRNEEAIIQMAHHDDLTGLPNRLLLNDRLNLEIAHAHRNQQKLAVMLLDLDHFKDVNDTLGHSVGDHLLQVVGERLTNVLREADTVARMGGDEFMLVLPEIAQHKDADEVAAKILEALKEPFVFDCYEIDYITTSIGIALYPDDGEDEDTLMKNADTAMYRAKDQGRDNYQRFTQPQ